MKLQIIKENDNSDMYYRLSHIDDTDKLIKDFNRKWNAFKSVEPEKFNAHVKNNAQDLRNHVWDALNALIRAMKATSLSESLNESPDIIGIEKAKDIINNFNFSGDWFEDFNSLEDLLTDYYRNEVEVYNDNIAKRIKKMVLDAIIEDSPELEDDIMDEFF